MASPITVIFASFILIFSNITPSSCEVFDSCDGTGTWEIIDNKGTRQIYQAVKLSTHSYKFGKNNYDKLKFKKDDVVDFTLTVSSSAQASVSVDDSNRVTSSLERLMNSVVYRCLSCEVCFKSSTVIQLQAAESVTVSVKSPNIIDNQSRNIRIERLQQINHVHVIYMNHLDVGYNTNQNYPNSKIPMPGFINNVLNWYFQVYFPRAVKLADELRMKKANETFIYTTHPWLVSLYIDCPPNLVLSGIKLKCPSSAELDVFKKAVYHGDITWHAGPFNQEPENFDSHLFDHSLYVSEDLDKIFGIERNYRTLSQRDIPGMTKAVIPFMAKHNISAISVGINPMSATPDVPSPNIWRFNNKEVVTYWHKGGYPENPGKDPKHPGGLSRKDCQTAPGLDHALCFAFRTDNYGPPDNTSEIRNYFKILRSEFPGAEIKASTFESFTKVLYKVKDRLPVVTSEIGDTWIQGTISDPLKIATYRAIKRARSQCFNNGRCSLNDPRIRNSTRFLIKLPEHTYGIAGEGDYNHWSNAEFYPLQFVKSGFLNCTRSWMSHRKFNDLAIEALGDHSLVADIKAELRDLQPSLPDLTGYVKDSTIIKDGIKCKNGLRLRMNEHGSLVELYDPVSQRYWASDITPLGQVIYNTYSQNDTNNMTRYYDYEPGGAGFIKTNVSKANPESKSWFPDVVSTYVKQNTTCICESGIFVQLAFTDTTVYKKYGAPQVFWIKYQLKETSSSVKRIDIDFQFFDKYPTRLPEALFFNFHPVQQPGHRWLIEKLGQLIDPTDVVLNGSQYQHGIDQSILFLDNENKGLVISANETNIVSVVTKDMGPTVYPAPLFPLKSKPLSMAFNIINNVWETNFIFWYPYLPQDKDFKSRFSILLKT